MWDLLTDLQLQALFLKDRQLLFIATDLMAGGQK
jgi:hypothetical protein